jgi:hypothetical protein
MVDLNEKELARRNVSHTVEILNTHETYKLADLIAQYGEGLELYVETNWYYDDCEVTIRLSCNRLETDDEYETRIEKLKAKKAKAAIAAEKRRATALAKKLKKDDEERKLYEALKAKFEGE